MPPGMPIAPHDIRHCARNIREIADKIRDELSVASPSDRKAFWSFVHVCDPLDAIAYDPDRAMKMVAEVRAIIESVTALPNNAKVENASTATLAVSEPQNPAFPKRPTTKHPSDTAIAAYRLWFVMGRPQKEIAEVLQQETGQSVSQGQVSRWISRVTTYVNAGNVLPDAPKVMTKSKSIDPSRIDIGKRTDGRTLRQRHKESDEE
jgi:hypothetical protein